MRFRVRNLFYLRLSSSDVIPLYLYLDERHVDWMSERTLQAVVADLRPLIGPKLEAERYAHYGPGGPANAKKGTVEVHRGTTYQFAYFVRKSEPHNIVFKARNYIMVDRDEGSSNAQAEKTRENTSRVRTNERRAAKRTKRPRKPARSKKGKIKAQAIEINDDQEEEEAEESSLSELDSVDDVQVVGEGPSIPRRSTRRKKQRTVYREISDDESRGGGGGTDEDVDMQDERADGDVQVKQEMVENEPFFDETENADNVNNDLFDSNSNRPPPPPDFSINVDEEEEEEKKSKPVIQLSFRSLNMHDRCLCVVVEPWPPLPTQPTRPTPAPSYLPALGSMPEEEPEKHDVERSPSVRGPGFERASSIVSSRFSVAPRTDREETPLPLFLPDPTGRDRSATPAPARFPSEFTPLHTIDTAQYLIDDDDNFGMMTFSQVLNNVSGDRIGAAEEDDEMDGGALYGDADEIRGAI